MEKDKLNVKIEELESNVKDLTERVDELHKRIINHELQTGEYKDDN